MLEAIGSGSLLAARAAEAPRAWVFGADETPGIVSVAANRSGHVRVWRRRGERTKESRERFPAWFLTSHADLLAHLPVRWLSAADFGFFRTTLGTVDAVTVVELEGGRPEAFRYLVLTDALDEVESTIVETWNKRSGSQAQSFADLGDVVAIWPPVEQYLMLTGRTYFKGMAYADLRRLQFDLETTGLNEQRDRIFMVSMSDSTGWQASLDTGGMTEAELLERFVELVAERDPDVLENHNIFAFDLSFLARRAATLGVRLALGRDGSEPVAVPDILQLPNRVERFVRWRVAGREVLDTLHAVKRYTARSGDLRRHGLKDVARYFGFAKPDREYVPGPEVWSTFKRDPDRVRRYAADDVHEADGISRTLLGVPFALASVVPRAYEQVAVDMSPLGTVDPVLVRAYLQAGRALPVPSPRGPRGSQWMPRAELYVRGVVRPAARLEIRPLFPHVLAQMRARAQGDHLEALPAILTSLLQEAAEAQASVPDIDDAANDGPSLRGRALAELAGLVPPYLATPGGFFSDAGLAARVLKQGRAAMSRVLAELQRLGAMVVEVSGESVLLALPDDWDQARERELLGAVSAHLPPGVGVERAAHFQALYARGERNHAVLTDEGTVRLVGEGVLGRGLEAYGEQFIRQAARPVLHDRPVALRELFVQTVAKLRAGQVPVDELCVQGTLRKSPAEYRESPYREEAYEVAQASGLTNWRSGLRIRYFRGRAGQPRLLREEDAASPFEADVEHYVLRLRTVYCPYFAAAYRDADFERLFAIPVAGSEADAVDQAAWEGVRTVWRQVRPPRR